MRKGKVVVALTNARWRKSKAERPIVAAEIIRIRRHGGRPVSIALRVVINVVAKHRELCC